MARHQDATPVYRSQTIATPIARPVREVYDFLAEPANFPKWAAVVGPSFTQIGRNDWVGEMAAGERVVRFSERNRYGILDHALFKQGEEPIVTPMRVSANGEGCLLTYTFFQRPGMSEEQFASTIEWITTDFLALKTLLEEG